MIISKFANKIKIFQESQIFHTVILIVLLIASNIISFYIGKDTTKDYTGLNKRGELVQINTANQGNYTLADIPEIKEGSLASAVYLSTTNDTTSQNLLNEAENALPRYVASKNGRVYYFTWCSGAKRILEENRVYFNSAEEARAKGLNKSTACAGLD